MRMRSVQCHVQSGASVLLGRQWLALVVLAHLHPCCCKERVVLRAQLLEYALGHSCHGLGRELAKH